MRAEKCGPAALLRPGGHRGPAGAEQAPPRIFTCWPCRALDVAPGEAWAIEDSYNGIRAAAAAGMRAIMVPDLLPPTREMEGLTAAILPDLDAVARYLEEHA